MRGSGGLQKVLYLIMAVLGSYILYKAGTILLESRLVQQALDSGEPQRQLEDAAVRTWMPSYAASVEERGAPDWIAQWMRPLLPVYSYLADGQAGDGQAPEEVQSGRDALPETAETEQVVLAGTEELPETAAPEDDAGSPAGQAEADSPGEQAETERPAQEPGIQEPGEQESAAVLPAAGKNVISGELLQRLEDFDYLLANYYTVDEGTTADEELLDASRLLGEDLRLEQDASVPQILIYHTHSQEAFLDSREGETEDSIVGMGELLARELRNTYGYNVIHDTGVYDLVDGLMDRSAAYDYAREAVEQILQEHPTIEVIIDLHRDGVEGVKFVTEIDGQPVSRIMFFNGISRDSQDQPLAWLENPYLSQNLAFSLQLQLAAEQEYPGFTRNIYLKAERFNLHLRPRSLLIEAGTQLNTVEEERNAMRPLAALLNRVLKGEAFRSDQAGARTAGGAGE